MNITTNVTRGFGRLATPMAWVFAFGAEALTIITLNALTLTVLTRTYGLRKKTTYFLINLTITDLLVGLLPVPMYMIYIADEPLFYRTKNLLKAFQALDMIFGACSIWTLALISMERLCIVLIPYYHRSAKGKNYYYAMAFCWLLPILISGLGFLASHGVITRKVYLNLTFIFLLFIPTATLVISHVVLGIKFNHRNLKSRRARQENALSKTLFIVTATFLASFLPFQSLVFYMALRPTSIPPLTVVVALKLLQYGNSFMNPIIYWPRLPGFKAAAKKLVSKSRRYSNTEV
ncbi:tachykinin-like peptides receptor 99D [Actinia tenebrosa]|uniref:Tachykinin-like peptides receptor 99D n=1 Tax=Actinia tenebrosa TaxID=6105 RepID=A0A6P8IX82_ACTTE|nr:tachykinin-like peptides receptor 99D [Actinia tenebrosa]XP_031570554.1 tachykinin-like peptides receptor 99D [Actinia tenebrosa]XP_031570555.1 tachykinin-like peptides receptor 99D [Actinia tenebrosa]XP_031570556.1 tachykinin-like peptides receptor 99D [Actinia tenebrosa]XP_031570557.1 tachykinin-like peptides receptor 99D [Actinia tenebrosa]